MTRPGGTRARRLVVSDAETVERVAHAVDRLDRLAPDGGPAAEVASQLQEDFPDAPSNIGGELLKRRDGRRREFDAVGVQATSFRLVLRPCA